MNNKNTLKITVKRNGEVLMNDQSVSPSELVAVFRELAYLKGTVWYYREDASVEPPPSASKVIQLIVDYQLPVSVSSQSDFSDYIDEHGISHPRL